ncbi:MAG: signal peptidase I [bacterium]
MQPTKTKSQSFWEIVRFAVIALVIVVPIRFFIAEPFVVSGSSMVPTFENSNYLIVDKISYDFSEPQRDDVVVFRYPKDTTKFFIKRIIGLPGETVDVKSAINEVTITNKENPEGLKLDQSFIKNIGGLDKHMTLGADEYFVMGDNRSGSSDSRYWGAVKRNLLTGKVFLRLFPINKINIWPGDYKQNDNS